MVEGGVGDERTRGDGPHAAPLKSRVIWQVGNTCFMQFLFAREHRGFCSGFFAKAGVSAFQTHGCRQRKPTSRKVGNCSQLEISKLSNFALGPGGTDWWLQRVSDAGSILGQTQLGAANDDVARSLAVDANDNLWAAGWSGGPSPRTPFIFKMVPPGYGLDVYDHPSSSGTAFFGGITIESTGNAIAVGGSTGTIDGLTSSGDYDFLLMVYSNAGVKQFTRLTGSSGQDDAYSVTTDSSDNIVVLGETSGSMSGFTNAGVPFGFASSKIDNYNI